MKTALFAVGVLIIVATPALTQEVCPADPPAPDPCMVGHWVGENTAAQRLNEMLRSMPSSAAERVVFPALPATMGMTVFADGFYSTLPLHQDLTWQEVYSDGTVTTILDLTVGTQLGHIWGDGGLMSFCALGGSVPGGLAYETEGPSESVAGFIPLGGGPAFVPFITYSCGGDAWQFTVQLPAPIGPIDYHLTKFPESRFDEAFIDWLETRLPVE